MTGSNLINPLTDLSKELNISKEELLISGCKYCVWKMHGMCSYGTDHPDGICKEFSDFLVRLNDGDRNPNKLWENYHLFIMRLQSMQDYKDFLELDAKVKEMENGLVLDPKEVKRLEFQRDNLRTWWMRLNDTIMKGLGKSLDRSSREDNVDKTLNVMKLSDINRIISGNISDDSDNVVPAEYKDIIEDEN